MERNAQLLGRRGITGAVVPSAFHANEGATGIRRLYLEEMALHCCYSFENRRKLFEIDSRFKFALVVAARSGPTVEFPCAFYLHDDEWLFGDRGTRQLRYTLDFVHRTGGEYLTLLELRSPKDLEVAEVCFKNGEPFGQVCERHGIRLGRELNMTDDAWRFTSIATILPGSEDPRDPIVARSLLEMGYLVLHEGKTFHQFTDRWEDRPRYVIPIVQLADKPLWKRSTRYFRLAFRDIARSTDERTAIFCFLPGGIVLGNTTPCEREPYTRQSCLALCFQAYLNSYAFDWTLRQKSAAHVNIFILAGCSVPRLDTATRSPASFLAHSALRLTCNHDDYEPLWREQLDDTWREPNPPFTWPILQGDDARWAVRAVIDAVVADAYGLSREQYAHVLSTFSHRSYPKAPELCMARFDELKTLGFNAFSRKYDPYWDIPLNENLPEPVITLPVPEETTDTTAQQLLGFRRPVTTRHPYPFPAADIPKAAESQPSYRPPHSASTIDEAAYARLCQLLDAHGAITSRDVQDYLGLPAAAIRPLLNHLVETGKAVREGQGRGTRYRRVER